MGFKGMHYSLAASCLACATLARTARAVISDLISAVAAAAVRMVLALAETPAPIRFAADFVPAGVVPRNYAGPTIDLRHEARGHCLAAARGV